MSIIVPQGCHEASRRNSGARTVPLLILLLVVAATTTACGDATSQSDGDLDAAVDSHDGAANRLDASTTPDAPDSPTDDNSPFEPPSGMGGASSCGKKIGVYRSVVAFSNGATYDSHKCSDQCQGDYPGSLTCTKNQQDGCVGKNQTWRTAYGIAYQCVEYVRRFYASRYGKTLKCSGNAVDYWKNPDPFFDIVMQNGKTKQLPQPDDVVVFSESNKKPEEKHYGHISIVRDVTKTKIITIQQNVANSAIDDKYKLNIAISQTGEITLSDADGWLSKYSVLGWMRSSKTNYLDCSAGDGCPDGFTCVAGTCVAATASKCGNGVREGPEECDGNDLGGVTCAKKGFKKGVLVCASDCTHNTKGCCNDVCILGKVQCFSPTVKQLCADWDSNGCSEWGSNQSCAYGCKNGQCVKKCGNGFCDTNENCSTCVADCGCIGAKVCINGSCSNCGNSVVEAGEKCDTAISSGQSGACPTSCNDGKSCTADKIEKGGTCQAACSYTQITTCKHGDSCCLSSCNANNDNDCSAVCGNGICESGEDCSTCSADCSMIEIADYKDNDCDGLVDEDYRILHTRLYYSNGQSCGNPTADWDHCYSTGSSGSPCVGTGQGGGIGYSIDAGKSIRIYSLSVGKGNLTAVVGSYTLALLGACYDPKYSWHIYEPTTSSDYGQSGWVCEPIGYVRTGYGIPGSVAVYRHQENALTDRMYSQVSNEGDELSKCKWDHGKAWWAWSL